MADMVNADCVHIRWLWMLCSAGLSPRVAPCQNLRGGAHSTISVLIIEKS